MQDLGLYIHIPFCLHKCAYCDFLSVENHDFMAQYVDCLCAELTALCDLAENAPVSTVYIGGGTPTTLNEQQFARIFEKIRAFSLTENAEITVEANPETVTLGKMRFLRQCGANRISLGVQAMDDAVLKLIERPHNTLKVLESYAALRIAGFQNISYDLILNLPNQTSEGFLAGLTDLLKLNPCHLSLYSLQLEEGTKLFKNQAAYRFLDEDEERNTYHAAQNLLLSHGLAQYEISNFAKPGFASRHNIRYWDGKPYLGAGLGASSYFKGVRYENPADFAAYFSFCNAFTPLYKTLPPLTQAERQSEFFFLGLRKTEGVSLSAFQAQFGIPAESVFGAALQKHLANGLLQKTGDRVFLSPRGLDLANAVMRDFV